MDNVRYYNLDLLGVYACVLQASSLLHRVPDSKVPFLINANCARAHTFNE